MIKDVVVSAGLIISNRKKLFVRAREDDIFMSPGGKPEAGETPFETLQRELHEELNIHVTENDVEYAGEMTSVAFGRHRGKTLLMHCYIINSYSGTLQRSAEISELAWMDSKDISARRVAPIESESIIPFLVKRGLIS